MADRVFTIPDRGFVDQYLSQKAEARIIFGMDPRTRGLGPNEADLYPFTALVFAKRIAHWWLALFQHPTVQAGLKKYVAISATTAEKQTESRGLAGLFDDVGSAVVQGLGAEPDRTENYYATVGNGLAAMFQALKDGADNWQRDEYENPCLNPGASVRFWEAIYRIAQAENAANIGQVTHVSYWTLAGEQWEITKESIKDIADAAGQAAGEVAAVAGGAIGRGVSGFINQLGVVQVAAIGGAIYFGMKYV